MEIDDRPLIVSIWCATYNQEKYIRQCLDGFVMQKTNFRFEAIVHDDASTDGTSDIVREYAEKYPDIIKPIIETENQYSKQDGSLDRIMYETCTGKYIAFCEGDDYWTDSLKLQKQLDYLEAHPECSCCVHEYKEWIEDKQSFRPHSIKYLRNFHGEGLCLDIKEYAKSIFFTKTLTAVYPAEKLRRSKYNQYDAQFDMTMFFALATQGPIYLMNQTMGVYRMNEGGVTSDKNRNSFYMKVIPQLFSVAKVEKTIEAKQFVYEYIKDYPLFFLLKRHDLLKLSLRYLGLKYNLLLYFKQMPLILWGILIAKLSK